MRMIHTKGPTFVVFCLAVIFLASGCAATNKIAKDITGKGGRLKTKVAFLPTSNKVGSAGEVFEKSARAYFKDFVERSCDHLIIMNSEETRDLLADIPRLPSGQIDNLALAELGRALGLNVVLEEGISELECVAYKRGFWGFRSTRTFAELSVSLRGYDIESGAILFEEAVRDEVEISERECEDVRGRNGHHTQLADPLLAKIIPELGEKGCELVGDQLWKGYIISASGHTFTLTAGSDVGLAEGDVLDVFGMGEPVKGHAGQSYLVSGPKIGELKITRVYGNRAEATGDLASDLQEISHVKLKQ
jgi:hypothetical protein